MRKVVDNRFFGKQSAGDRHILSIIYPTSFRNDLFALLLGRQPNPMANPRASIAYSEREEAGLDNGDPRYLRLSCPLPSHNHLIHRQFKSKTFDVAFIRPPIVSPPASV
jgi:hypothetical protein